MSKIIIILTLIFAYSAYAEIKESQFSLLVGGGLSHYRFETDNPDPELTATDERETDFWGISISSHVNFELNARFSFNLSSYIVWGEATPLKIDTGNEEIAGEGALSSTSFGLITWIKIPELNYKGWAPFVEIGPLWGLHTFRVKEGYQLRRGDYKSPYKVTYTSYGILVGAGIYQNLKQDYPIMVDVAYIASRTYRMAIVDSKNHREVETLSEDKNYRTIFGHLVIISITTKIF